MKKIMGLILIGSIIISLASIIVMANKRQITVYIENTTQDILQNVRVELGVGESVSKVMEIKPQQIGMADFQIRKPTHIRLQYQIGNGEKHDLIVQGYIGKNASGEVRIFVQDGDHKYKIGVSQNIRY